MPAEYTECVQSYLKKGVSERTAKARCAAMYYKRHGTTVNEAAKKEGEATVPETDNLYERIKLIDGRWKKPVKASSPDCGCKATATAPTEPLTITATTGVISMNFDLLDDGIVEIVATKEGARAYTSDGLCLTWPKSTLLNGANTWIDGTVSINHKLSHIHGTIVDSWMDEPSGVRMVLHVDDLIAKYIPYAKELGLGVSIEAGEIAYDEKTLEIISFKGTGVTFVFPPETPACSPDEGCVVLATEATPEINTVADKDLTNSVNTVSATEEVAPTSVDATQGEKMTEISANEKALADKLAATEKEVAELRAFREAKMAEERDGVLKVIATFVDATPFKDEHLCSLKAVATALATYKAKMAEEPIVNSGATPDVKATEPEKKDDLPKIEGATPEEIKEFVETAKVYEARYNRKVM